MHAKHTCIRWKHQHTPQPIFFLSNFNVPQNVYIYWINILSGILFTERRRRHTDETLVRAPSRFHAIRHHFAHTSTAHWAPVSACVFVYGPLYLRMHMCARIYSISGICVCLRSMSISCNATSFRSYANCALTVRKRVCGCVTIHYSKV